MLPEQLMTRIRGSLLLLVIIATTACKDSPKVPIKTTTITFTKEGEAVLYKSDTDSLLVRFDVEIADTDYETQTGLMYRESMAENQAMLFVFDDMALHSFYMKNTKFPLDIIYFDDQLRVASFIDNAVPLDESGLSSEVPIQYVLEINAGLRAKWGISTGDRLSYTRN